jgi:hypothetical protein
MLLRKRFGPECERTVTQYGERPHAERALEQGAKRMESYRIRPLNLDEQQRFSEIWRQAQAALRRTTRRPRFAKPTASSATRCA